MSATAFLTDESDSMDHLEDILKVLRKLKRKHKGPLPLDIVFRKLIEGKVCDSSKTVSESLRKLQGMGKIKPVDVGVNIELLEEVKVKYIQASLSPFKK